jgi:hypothetical protein
MANSKNVPKKLEDEIDSGFKLFEEYKEASDEFVRHMNEEIDKIGIKFGKKTSLTEKKKTVMNFLKEIEKSFMTFSANKTDEHFNYLMKYDLFSPLPNLDPNGKKKALYDLYSNALDIIKSMMLYERSFIEYKREQRAKKTKILNNIHKLQELFKNSDAFTDKALEKIYSKKLKIGSKIYTLKHLLGHLEAGEISDSVNNFDHSLKYFKTLQLFLNREEKMVSRIKALKVKENPIRQEEKLFKIRQAIIKIYENRLVGAPVPSDIKEVIKILNKQTLTDPVKVKFEKLKKDHKTLVSKINKLQKESNIKPNVKPNVTPNEVNNQAGFQLPTSQLKATRKKLRKNTEEIQVAEKEMEVLHIKHMAIRDQLEKNFIIFKKNLLGFHNAGMQFKGLNPNDYIEIKGRKIYFKHDGIDKILNLKKQAPKVQEWIDESKKNKEDLENLAGEILEEIEEKDLEIARLTL